VQYTGTFGSKLVTTVLVGTWGYNFPQVPYGVFEGDPGTASCPCAKNLPQIPLGTLAPRRVDNASANTAGAINPSRANPRRYQLEPTASYFLDNFLHANHQLKFGYVYEKETGRDENYAGIGGVQQLTYNSTGLPDFSTPFRVTINNSPRVQLNAMIHSGLYLTDQVKVHKRVTLNIGVRWDRYRSYYRDEELRSDCLFCDYFYRGIALPNGSKLPATPFANGQIPGKETNVLPRQIAPRIGLAIDLFGTGRTVLNLNWGQYYTNMARNLASGANPLQSATAQFTWNNPNNLPFNINQLGAIVGSPSIAQGSIIDPNLRDPRMDDMGIILQHQLTPTVSMRGGFIFRELYHDFETIVPEYTSNLFTIPMQVTLNGINGTLTQSRTITLYDIPKANIPATTTQLVTSPDGNKAIYRNFEFTINKRMSSHFSVVGNFYWTHTTANIGGLGATGCSSCGLAGALASTGTPNIGVALNPNQLYNSGQSYNQWTSHIDGTYEAKWGIRVSPTLRMQQGQELTETQVVTSGIAPGATTATAFNIGQFYVPVTPTGGYRNPDLYVFDTRIEKDFRFKERFKINVIFDAFNIFNTNAANTVSAVDSTKNTTVSGTGGPLDGQKFTYQGFLSPTVVLPPRVVRLGVRFSF
jgi:hypothetical protein